MTKKDIIANAFLNGVCLTTLSAYRIAQTTELRKIVSDLRKQGWKILDETVPNFLGKGHHKEYWMTASERARLTGEN